MTGKVLVWILLLTCAGMVACAADQGTGLSLRVNNIAGVTAVRPVTGGVPLAEGAVPEGSRFFLQDGHGKGIPLQTEILARWKDGSARWVLLDFQASPTRDGASDYTLAWRKDGAQKEPQAAVKATGGPAPSLSTDTLTLTVDGDKALLRIGKRLDIRLVLDDGDGRQAVAVLESAGIETTGPMRSTLALRGFFRSPDGERLFGFRMRASVFAGLPYVYLEPMICMDTDRGLMHYFRSLRLKVTPRGGIRDAALGGSPGWQGPVSSPVRLFQVDDRNYRVDGADISGKRAPGWATFTDGGGRVAVALRDFWQQWPKSIGVDSGGLSLGLYPAFEKGSYDHMEPWYKYRHLYDDDRYRLRTSQSRRWQVWLDLSGDGEALSRMANAPLVPTPDPVQAISTGVWGHVAPAATPGMEEYYRWAESACVNGYLRSIEEQRDYGEGNWGDWWGERGVNWGNHEYDTPKHLLVLYACTGDPKYLYAGDIAARHMSEVDVVNFVNDDLRAHFDNDLDYERERRKLPDIYYAASYPVRPGMVHDHCLSHVSGYYHPEHTVEDATGWIAGKPYDLGHLWTQGMVYQYFLTGDRWVRETVERIGENLARLAEDRQYQFKGRSFSGRQTGWSMLALAGAYELNFDDRYLNAMKLIADDALSEQDSNCGGWLYTMGQGHCNCTTKHVGEAGFMGSIRINGLVKYYELTGDVRIPDAVTRWTNHFIRDTWVEQLNGWCYTSCPATKGSAGQSGVTVMAMVNGVSLGKDPEHLRILRKAWDAKFTRLKKEAPSSHPGGKGYSSTMCGSTEAMSFFVSNRGK